MLASTFRAVSETFPVGHSSGVLTAWQQNHGHLLVGGDMKVVRLLDATVERHLRVSALTISLEYANELGYAHSSGSQPDCSRFG